MGLWDVESTLIQFSFAFYLSVGDEFYRPATQVDWFGVYSVPYSCKHTYWHKYTNIPTHVGIGNGLFETHLSCAWPVSTKLN